MMSLTLQEVIGLAGVENPPDVDFRSIEATSAELLSTIEETRELVNKDLALAMSRSKLLIALADQPG